MRWTVRATVWFGRWDVYGLGFIILVKVADYLTFVDFFVFGGSVSKTLFA